MRRASALLFPLALAITAPLTAQSDSSRTASSDSSRTIPFEGGRVAPVFHAGQWAAQFGLANGFYGIGVLRHRSPNSAWALNAAFHVTRTTQDPGDYRGHYSNIFLSAGRRLYRAGSGRIRPFREFGISGAYTWGSSGSGSGPYDTKSRSYGGGVYGKVGAMVFFAPELGLGATWDASATYFHDHYEYISAPPSYSSSRDYLSFDAGGVSLIGAFYF